ncbi:MAG: RNA polymerase sigma factor, partial [Oscillospiraceae bacterium]|nr:RNA polymerase sigma factor [Oscillospiraceae bacterium]
RRYTGYVSSIIRRILNGCRQDCEELTCEVFLVAWNNRDKLQEGRLRGYLGAVARNKAFQRLRSMQETLPLEESIIVIEEESVEDETQKRDDALLLEKALSMLDRQQRELFVRHYYYGQTVKEAAEEMQVNPSTAKSWLARGREKLKEILEKEGYTV